MSRCGSDVTNTTDTWARSAGGNVLSAAAMSAMVVGQMSGQWVYPKNSRVSRLAVAARKS